ncbi:MAG TPA: hypothetical protein VKQ36_00860 [Ktedonobacterales bacterium]|nr:hypothetical protein [Ktedonobacterales bacterium]
MGKLIDKLQQVGKGGESGMGFMGFGRPRSSGQAPRPMGLLVSLRATDAAQAEAAAKNGADAVIITGWTPNTNVSAVTAALASAGTDGNSAPLWGAELGEIAADANAPLKAARDAGAGFVILPTGAPVSMLFEKVEQFDRVVTVSQPEDQMGLLALRAVNMLPAQAAYVRLDLSAAALAQLSVADFAQTVLLAESLRFPLLASLAATEALNASAARTLVQLGIDALVLSGGGLATDALGATVKATREALEKTPARETANGSSVSVGGLMGAGAGLAPGTPGIPSPRRQPEPEPDEP